MDIMSMQRHRIAAAAAVLALAVPAFGQTSGPGPEVLKRRYQIKVMEGVLQGAVRHGADVLSAELRPINPNLVLLTGLARARGTILDGYGVFFDVEIPALRESVAWSIRTMALEPDPLVFRSLEQLKREAAAIPDTTARASLQQQIAELESRMGVNALGASGPESTSQNSSARRVSNQQRSEGFVAAPTADVARARPAPQLQDPNEMYTRAVKDALIDAMLDHSGPMDISSDEWLTVAARDADGPLGAGEPYDAMTLVLRIKGGDLADFRAGRITRDQARERVDVREF
jgi:hypothetical protein